MVLSFIIAAEIWTWKASVLLLATLLVHEAGHLLAMRHYGMSVRAVVFVPLLGAGVVPSTGAPTERAAACVALCGPLLGLCSATVVLGAWVVTQVPLLFAVATFIIAVNLFNLMPLPFFDGGKIAKYVFWTDKTPLGYGWRGGLVFVSGSSLVVWGSLLMHLLNHLVSGCPAAWREIW